MGKAAHPISTRLGLKNVFWNSELYSYYYTIGIKKYLKISTILEKLFKFSGLFLLSFKVYFINNVFFFLTNYRRYYWKFKCPLRRELKRKRCPFIWKVRMVGKPWCSNVQCLLYKKDYFKNKKQNKKQNKRIVKTFNKKNVVQ